MIRVEDRDGRRTITLDRPDKANALTGEMLGALAEAAEAARDAALGGDGPRVLALTGAGSAFSAGADIEAARAGLARSPLWDRLSAALAGFPGLSVAALNGSCAGGAMGMMLACDLRLAVPTAKFFYPVVKLGFLPQPADPARLAALVGPARAKMILVAGAKVGAEEALAWGLVDRIVAPESLDDAVAELAAPVTGAAAEHVRAVKAMVPCGPAAAR